MAREAAADEVCDGVLDMSDGVWLPRAWMSEYRFGVATAERDVLAVRCKGLLLGAREVLEPGEASEADGEP